VDPRCFQNYHPFASRKMTDLEEDFLEAEGFLEAEDSPEEEEDSLEEVGTQVEVEYHPVDHQEEDGDRHQPLYHKHNRENW